MGLSECFQANSAINRVCDIGWETLNEQQMTSAVWMFYFRSVQFRENLEAAIRLHPDNQNLRTLTEEELHTNNLSPYNGIAAEGEYLDHDTFLKRIIETHPIPPEKRQYLENLGKEYLDSMTKMPDEIKAMCLVSSEDGGSSKIYTNILTSPQNCWKSNGMQAFRHFLQKHVEFDSTEGEDTGHGMLVRKLGIDDRVAPMLDKFADCLEDAIDYDL